MWTSEAASDCRSHCGHVWGHLSVLMEDLRLSPPSAPSSTSDLVRCSVSFPCSSCCFCCCFFLGDELLTRRGASLMNHKNTITNACFSSAYLMETAEQITYLWIIRPGGEGGGMVPWAMRAGTKVPSALASVRQEGPRGPAGWEDGCYQQQ